MIASNVRKGIMNQISTVKSLVTSYPGLMVDGNSIELTPFSFLFGILRKLGVTEQQLIDWLSGMLCDGANKTDGFLTVIEGAVKTALLAYFNGQYGCQINPIIPKSVLYEGYDSQQTNKRQMVGATQGIKIGLNDIDVFGILNHCPVNSGDTIFYFDADRNNGYNVNNLSGSTDFNAFLWYVINNGKATLANSSTWDNRAFYRKHFLGADNVIHAQNDTSDGSKNRKKFFEAQTSNWPSVEFKIDNDTKKRTKYDILSCYFSETEAPDKGGELTVFLNGNRYNSKTIMQFNTEYLLNMKLFDSKTLLTNIINTFSGVIVNTSESISLKMEIMSEIVSDMIDQALNDEEEKSVDCYFTFSDEKYDAMYKRALEKYTKRMNVENPIDSSISREDINNSLTAIEKAGTPEEQITEIKNTITNLLNRKNSKSLKFSYDLFGGYEYLEKFVKEVIKQVTMSVLTPKIMLLYAINSSIYAEDKSKVNFSFENLINDFTNILGGVIKGILDELISTIGDLVISYIRDLISLYTDKLLKESLDYYIALLNQLVMAFKLFKRRANETFNGNIDDVYGADIDSLVKSTPKTC